MSPPDDSKPTGQEKTDQEKPKPKLNLLGHAQDVLSQTNDIILQSFQGTAKSKGESAKPTETNTQAQADIISDDVDSDDFTTQVQQTVTPEQDAQTPDSAKTSEGLPNLESSKDFRARQELPPPSNDNPPSSSGMPSNPPALNPTLNSTFVFINPDQANSGSSKVKEDSNGLGAWVIIFVFLLLFSVTGLGYIYQNHPEWLGLGKPKETLPVTTQPESPSEIVIPPPATDLAGTPHEEVIQDLISLNLVSMDQRSFHPMKTITRGEFVTWLVKSWNRTHTDNNTLRYIPSESVSFPDVTSEDPAYSSIQMLARTGYLYGYEDGSFKPNQAITREEMLYMADGIHKMQREAPSSYYQDLLKKVYLDGDQADLKYVRAIYDNQYRNQYVWGKTELLKPKEQVKRYEAALVLHTLGQTCPLEVMANTVRSQRHFTDTCAKPNAAPQNTYHAIEPIIDPNPNTYKETP
jgi:hypothetical protein